MMTWSPPPVLAFYPVSWVSAELLYIGISYKCQKWCLSAWLWCWFIVPCLLTTKHNGLFLMFSASVSWLSLLRDAFAHVYSCAGWHLLGSRHDLLATFCCLDVGSEWGMQMLKFFLGSVFISKLFDLFHLFLILRYWSTLLMCEPFG